MATIVGSLQVNVTTGQATLTFDDAKKKLDEFGESGRAAGEKLDYSMREARESITLTGEALGTHLPGGIARVIASIGPLGPALQAALPAVAIVAAIGLIVELGTKIQEYALKLEKARESQTVFGTAIKDSLRGLEDKFLQAGVAADNLTGNHLGALRKELEIIDNTTLKDLEAEFGTLAAAADKALDQLKTHWYEFGEANAHAKFNLTEFKTQYDDLLASGDKAGAAKLLAGTLEYEQKILDLQKQAKSSQAAPDKGIQGDYQKYEEAMIELRKTGVDFSEREIKAQQELVSLLKAQQGAAKIIADTENQQSNNTRQQAANKIGQDKLKTDQQLLDLRKQLIADQSTLNDLEAAGSVAGKGQQSLQEQLSIVNQIRDANIKKAQDTYAEAERTYELQKNTNVNAAEQIEAKNKLEIAAAEEKRAIDKANADAEKQTAIETLVFKVATIKEELEARTKAAQQAMKLAGEVASEDAEVNKAENAQKATAISDAEKLGLISKREALTETIALLKQEGAERQAEIAKERDAKLAANAAELDAIRQAAADRLAANKGNAEDPEYKAYLAQINDLLIEQDAIKAKGAADEKTAAAQNATAIKGQITDVQELDHTWTAFFAHFKQGSAQNAADYRQSMQTAFSQVQSSFNNSVAQTIVMGKSFGAAMRQVAAQFLESMITANLRWLESSVVTHQATTASAAAAGAEQTSISLGQNLIQRFDNAKTAASKAMASVPFPFDLIVGPLVFAAALAFAEGGIVPGSGSGDTVPAMLTPGEAVLPQPMVEKLATASGGGDHHHYHYSPNVNIKAWDSSDMRDGMMQLKGEFFKEARKESRRRHRS